MRRGAFSVRLFAAALSAVLLWIAFPPHAEFVAVLFALAPLLCLVRRSSPKTAAVWGFATGLGFWLLTLAWMPAIVKNGGPWPLVFLGLFGLAAWCAVFFALFAFVSAWLWTRLPPDRSWCRWLGLVLEALVWAVCEMLRGALFTGFAWNGLGVALAPAPALASPALLGGVPLVSALVVLVNGVVATLFGRVFARMRRERDARPRWMRSLDTALPLAIVVCVYAFARGWTVPGERTPVRVALVQRNAPCLFKDRSREDPREAFDRLTAGVPYAAPDLVVLAESALSEWGPVRSPRAGAFVRHVLETTRAGALLGGGDDVRDVAGSRRWYNAAALYATNGLVDVYCKKHLVPFGEFIPLDKWITPLQALSPVGVSLYPGETKTLDVPLVGGRTFRVAPQICYEDTDASLARDGARQGAQAIVLVTNDSWFSHSVEPVQHAAHAVLRAIETGLPVVRVGNSGVTGVIDGRGRARWLADGDGKVLVDRAGCQVDTVNVPVKPVLTPYAKCGDAPLALCLLIALLVGAGGIAYGKPRVV